MMPHPQHPSSGLVVHPPEHPQNRDKSTTGHSARARAQSTVRNRLRHQYLQLW